MPRPGTFQHRSRIVQRLAPPANRGQIVDLLGVLEASHDSDLDLVALAAGPALDPRFDLRHLVRQGVHAGAGLRALAALAEARVIPPTGLPELATRCLDDGDATERIAARALLAAIGEPIPANVRVPRPRLAGVGKMVRNAWNGLSVRLAAPSSRSPSPDDTLDLDLPEPSPDAAPQGVGRAWQALAIALQPPLPPRPDSPWPARPRAIDLPRLTRSERLPQVLRAEAGHRRTGALAMMALGGPVESDGFEAGVFDALVQIVENDAPDNALDAALAALSLGRTAAPEATRRLARLALEAPDTDVACAAAEALGGQSGPIAREGLRDAVGRPKVAAVAALTAARIGDVGALAGIIALADHTSAEVRSAAARALGRVGHGPQVTDVLDRLATDPAEATAQAARASRAVHLDSKALHEWMTVAPATECAATLRLLGTRDRVDAWRSILRALSHSSPEVRVAATVCLGWLGIPGATPTLLRRLHDPSPMVGEAACDALARTGDARAVMPLRRLARRTDRVGAAARRALAAGRHLRSAPPDDRVRLRALCRVPLSLEAAGRLSSALQRNGLRCRVSAAGVHGDARVATDGIPRFIEVAEALNAAAEVAPELRWSVRDGQHLLRRHGRRWVVSRTRGRVVRDAGWFEQTPEGSRERPPLEAARSSENILSDDDLMLVGGPGSASSSEADTDDDLMLDELELDLDSDENSDSEVDLMLDDDLELSEDLLIEAPSSL